MSISNFNILWIDRCSKHKFNLVLKSSTGLDSNLALYSSHFLSQRVTGKILLNLMSGDLGRFGVRKVGDQMLLHDAIQSLRNVRARDRSSVVM